MRIGRPDKAPREANLIPLINVVFLMLVFFLVAGSLRPFLAHGINPAETAGATTGERPDGPLAISADGRLSIGGRPVAPADLATALAERAATFPDRPLFVVADRALAADTLLDVIEAARAAGIQKARLVTRRSPP